MKQKRKKTKLRIAAQWAGILFCIHQYSGTYIPAVGVNWFLNNPHAQIPVVDSRLISYSDLPGDFTARDYVNIANGLANEHAHDTELCKEFTSTTFSTYQRLVKQNGRSDLLDKVRIAADLLTDPEESHIWLQIKEGNWWSDYDAVKTTPVLEIGEVQQYSANTKKIKATFEDPQTPQYFSRPGEAKVYPNIAVLGDIMGINKVHRELVWPEIQDFFSFRGE